MTYDELDEIVDDAWLAFFNVFKDNGLDVYKIEEAMDIKDSFNDVEDAIMNAARSSLEGNLEGEE